MWFLYDKVYDDKIKKCNDKAEAFYTMLFEMIQSNWKIINDESPFTLGFKDMKAISEADIEKIIEIIYRESGYFTQLGSVLEMEDTSSFQKFYLLYKKEKGRFNPDRIPCSWYERTRGRKLSDCYNPSGKRS